MEKKLFILFIFTLSLCFSEDLNSIYKKAKELEDSGDYKSAMLLYKKIANESLKNPSLDKSEDLVIKEIKKEPKKEFFEHNIDKSKDKDTNDNLEQLVTKDFGIYPYKKNYFLPATYTFNNILNRDNFETSFQISLEKPISNDFFGLNEIISIAYTQKSFWQTASSSAPFRETNYEPEIFIQIPNDDKYLKLYKTSFLHTSNGKGGDDSRSLNRLYLQTFFQFDNLFVSPKIWYKIPQNSKDDDMKDFYKYYGYGDISFLYAYGKQTFELLLRDNLRLNSSNKGAVEFNYTFPLPDFISSKNSYGIFQVFHGYGQSLIDYDREVTNIGIGLTFSR
ncbi:phospholipase A [Aliarcobacter cryaerophilus]|uniref:phospholipase A n=1 Tax=Aliarcobacter cryaerophilus TaxID=28198 RepID=UPI00112F70BF|nr:phospholipase A [Aliarcobacter cryaerophilus]